jgi:hypothetical protein
LLQADLLKNAENNLKVLDEIGRQTESCKGRPLTSYELDRVNQDKMESRDVYIDIEEDYNRPLTLLS